MTTNFGGMPMDLQLQQSQLARREAVMQAMMQQGMTPVNAPQQGRLATRISPFQVLGQAMGAYMGAQGMEGIDKQRAQLGEQYNQRLGDSVRSYMQTRQGTPGVQPLTPNDDEGNPMPSSPGIKANPREAIVQAMTSGFGPLQAMAQNDLKQMNDQQIGAKDIMGFEGLDPKSKVMVAQMIMAGVPPQQAMNMLERKKDVRVNDGLVFDVSAGAPQELGYVGPQYVDETLNGPSGPIAAQRESRSGKVDVVDKTPRTTVNNTINTADKEGLQAATKFYGESASAARTAKEALKYSSQLRSLNANTPDGKTAQGEIWLRNLGEKMGLGGDSLKNVSGQAFQNLIMQKLSAQLIGPGGARISDSDRKTLEESLPQASYSQAARSTILDIMDKYSGESIKEYQRLRGRFQEAYPQAPVFGIDLIGEVEQMTPVQPTVNAPVGQVRPR